MFFSPERGIVSVTFGGSPTLSHRHGCFLSLQFCHSEQTYVRKSQVTSTWPALHVIHMILTRITHFLFMSAKMEEKYIYFCFRLWLQRWHRARSVWAVVRIRDVKVSRPPFNLLIFYLFQNAVSLSWKVRYTILDRGFNCRLLLLFLHFTLNTVTVQSTVRK